MIDELQDQLAISKSDLKCTGDVWNEYIAKLLLQLDLNQEKEAQRDLLAAYQRHNITVTMPTDTKVYHKWFQCMKKRSIEVRETSFKGVQMALSSQSSHRFVKWNTHYRVSAKRHVCPSSTRIQLPTSGMVVALWSQRKEKKQKMSPPYAYRDHFLQENRKFYDMLLSDNRSGYEMYFFDLKYLPNQRGVPCSSRSPGRKHRRSIQQEREQEHTKSYLGT